MKQTYKLIFLCCIFSLLLAGCSSHAPSLSNPKGSTSRPAILETASLVNQEQPLYYIPNTSIEAHVIQDLMMFQDHLLYSYYTYDDTINSNIIHLCLLDLQTGRVMHQTTVAIGSFPSFVLQICGDKLAVCDGENGILHIYDSNLCSIQKIPVESNQFYVNSTCTTAYCLRASGLYTMSLETMQETLLQGRVADLYECSWASPYLTFHYIDLDTRDKKECYSNLNVETGALEILTCDTALAEIFSGHAIIDNVTSRLLVAQVDGATQTMSAYDLEGQFLSSISSKDFTYTFTQAPAWHPDANGYFLIMTDSVGHSRLYFWDFSTKPSGQNLLFEKQSLEKTLTGTQLDASYYQRAIRLSQQYQVSIHIGDVCETTFDDKTAAQELDPAQISIGLDILEKAFQNYPSNFWSQLHYGAYQTLEIHLSGEIKNIDPIEGFTPTAFVQQSNGTIKMVLNINMPPETLESNIYHESSHIIDQILAHDANYREDSCYSEAQWSSLNPDSFVALNPDSDGYYTSYAMLPMCYFEEEYVAYFASDYGKTYATEDRATIFEAAMYTPQLFAPKAAAPIRNKLQYYCQCIRDYFDTTGWPEQTAWELPCQ